MDLTLTQTHVAFMLRCEEILVHNWDENLNRPSFKHFQGILESPGYAPRDSIEMTMGDKTIG